VENDHAAKKLAERESMFNHQPAPFLTLAGLTRHSRPMHYTLKLAILAVSSLALGTALRAGPAVADVGEAESFGHGALYMGASSGFVQLQPSCTPAPAPVPPYTANNDQCFELNAQPAFTNFTANDILRIKLPKKATRTIIYPAWNFFVQYNLKNQTAIDSDALFSFTATMDIQSDVLLDPSIIDPATGLPANGTLKGLFSYLYVVDRSLAAGNHDRQRVTLVRVGNAGINKASLVGLGLPQAVVDDLFINPMTVRMNMVGNTRLLNMGPGGIEGATITANMRLFGD
jgi:hypothetical protein